MSELDPLQALENIAKNPKTPPNVKRQALSDIEKIRQQRTKLGLDGGMQELTRPEIRAEIARIQRELKGK